MKYSGFCVVLLFFVMIGCNKTNSKTSNEQQIETEKKMGVKTQQGFITKKSNKNFKDTYTSLVNVITNNPNLKIIAELDHQNNAATVDLELRPTRIILFGNPKLGTPLMQNTQTIGLDLPQKILVWQAKDGTVNVSYNDPKYLQDRHGITDNEEILSKISGALDKITNMAAGLTN